MPPEDWECRKDLHRSVSSKSHSIILSHDVCFIGISLTVHHLNWIECNVAPRHWVVISTMRVRAVLLRWRMLPNTLTPRRPRLKLLRQPKRPRSRKWVRAVAWSTLESHPRSLYSYEFAQVCINHMFSCAQCPDVWDSSHTQQSHSTCHFTKTAKKQNNK